MASGIRLTGDWRKLRWKVGQFSDTAQYLADVILRELAERLKDSLHEVVNSSPAPANKASVIRRKGFDDPLHNRSIKEGTGMIDDDSVVVMDTEYRGKPAYFIEGNPEKLHPSGLSYKDIIAIAENGGGRVPARHVLSIAYDRHREEAEQYIRKRLNQHLGE